VTEYLPSERYGRANFVQRNRVQAALAAAVCPVEGRLQSGTAHTIRFAREYHRPLFAACRGEPHPDNELLDALIADGAPVFDLATDQGRRELREFLGRIEGERAPSPPPLDKQFWVRRALDLLRELRSYYDLTTEEKRRILNQVADAIGADPRTDTTRDGD
jgi:predicted Rossmann fold nucleotide-binding protein DprA/Smf involved in DNA uptake